MFNLDMSFIIGMEKQAQVTYEARTMKIMGKSRRTGEEECRRKACDAKRARTWSGHCTLQLQDRVTCVI